MKNLLVKLLTDSKGRFISLSTGLVVGTVARFFAERSWTLSEADSNYITLLVAALVGWTIDSVVLKLNSDGVKRIQDVLPPNIVSDGVPGDKTVAAVEKAVSESDSPTK